MHKTTHHLALLTFGLVFFQLLGCSSGDVIDTRVADFGLLDVNPNSATFNLAVSPRDHVGHTSAWFFGSAT